MVLEEIRKALEIAKKDLKIQFRFSYVGVLFEIFYPFMYFYIFILFIAFAGIAKFDPNYITYLAVGMMMFQIIYDLVDKIAWCFSSWESFSPNNLLSLPVSEISIITGKTIFAYFIGILRASLIFFLALIAGAKFNVNLLSFIVYFFSGTLIFVFLGLFLAGLWFIRRSFMNLIQKILVVVLFQVFGGVYFDPKILPASVSWISDFVPVYLLNNAMRGALINGATLSLDYISVMLAWIIILLPLSLKMFRFGRYRFNPEAG